MYTPSIGAWLNTAPVSSINSPKQAVRVWLKTYISVNTTPNNENGDRTYSGPSVPIRHPLVGTLRLSLFLTWHLASETQPARHCTIRSGPRPSNTAEFMQERAVPSYKRQRCDKEDASAGDVTGAAIVFISGGKVKPVSTNVALLLAKHVCKEG